MLSCSYVSIKYFAFKCFMRINIPHLTIFKAHKGVKYAYIKTNK